jgi:hypothetical protein
MTLTSKIEFALVAGNPQGPERLVTSVDTARAFLFLEATMRNLFVFLAGAAAILLTVIVDTKLNDEPSSFSFLLIGVIAFAVALLMCTKGGA